MNILVVDNSSNYILVLEDRIRFLLGDSVTIELFEVNKAMTSYEIAFSVIEYKKELDWILFINLHLECKDDRNNPQYLSCLGGLQVLQYLRLLNIVTINAEQFCLGYCIIYSPLSLENILRLNKNALLLCSDGTSFLQFYPTDNQLLALITKNKPSLINKSLIKPYFRLSSNLPDSRHQWANWWGLKHLYDINQKLSKNEAIKYPSYIVNELKSLKNLIIEFLYDSPLFNISDISKRINDRRSIIKNKNIKILFIDDQCENGWAEIFVHMIYGDDKIYLDGVYKKNREDTIPLFRALGNTDTYSLDIINMAIKTSFLAPALTESNEKSFPELIILDLRLTIDDNISKKQDISEYSGATILKFIKDKYLGIPVLITTASNKAHTLKTLKKIGADAYWIKKGIDDIGLAEDNNYENLLLFIDKLTDKEYKDFSSMVYKYKIIKEKTELYWWEEHTWVSTNETTKAFKTVVCDFIYESILMIRNYLHFHIFEYDAFNNATALQAGFWASTIIQRLGLIVEYIHQTKKVDINVHDGKKDSGSIMRNRRDDRAIILWDQRNEVSHYKHLAEKQFKGDLKSWDSIVLYYGKIIEYLKITPVLGEHPVKRQDRHEKMKKKYHRFK